MARARMSVQAGLARSLEYGSKGCAMRKLIVGVFVSLDGVMQAPGGPEEDPTGGFRHGGWIVPLRARPPATPSARCSTSRSTCCWGEQLRHLRRALAVSRRRIRRPKTTTRRRAYLAGVRRRHQIRRDASPRNAGLAELAGAGARHRHGGARPQADRRAGPGRAGVERADPHPAAAGLVDQMQLLIYPIILGKGKRLFDEGAAPPR